MKQNFSTFIFGTLLLSVLILLSCKKSETAVESIMTSNLRTMGRALREYTKDHDGKFPDSLDSLERLYLKNYNKGDWETFRDPSTNKESKWQFKCFSRSTRDFGAAEIIVESPEYFYRNSRRKLVLRNSGEVSQIVIP
jgi:hypothetical protein